MKHYILFTAVGLADPISQNKDGAILHICRKYKPEGIYLFLSKQMLENHQRDNRYRLSINKLSKHMEGFNPFVEIIPDEDLSEVHKFDVFYDKFEREINKIRKKHPDHTILLNISSGTPAMKSALNFIAAMHEADIVSIQVRNPYPEKKIHEEFKIEERWKSNLDNNSNTYEDRTDEEFNFNLIARLKKQILIKHTEVYDYHAAYRIAKEIETYMPGEAIQVLEAACCRLQLDIDGINQALKGSNYNILPSSKEDINLIEYLLWLQVKQSRRDYADFIRGITPVVIDLLEIILKRNTGIHLPDFYNKVQKGNTVTYYTNREKLNMTDQGREILEILDSHFRGLRDKDFYKSSHIFPLIKHYKKDEPILIKECKKIIDVEQKVRNLAAHEIISITEEWIEKRCGLTSTDIMDTLKYLATAAGIIESEDVWQSYKKMNEIIEAIINTDRR